MQSLCLKPWFLELYQTLLLKAGSSKNLEHSRVKETGVGSTAGQLQLIPEAFRSWTAQMSERPDSNLNAPSHFLT